MHTALAWLDREHSQADARKADRKSTKQAKKARKDEGIVDEEDLLQTLEGALSDYHGLACPCYCSRSRASSILS